MASNLPGFACPDTWLKISLPELLLSDLVRQHRSSHSSRRALLQQVEVAGGEACLTMLSAVCNAASRARGYSTTRRRIGMKRQDSWHNRSRPNGVEIIGNSEKVKKKVEAGIQATA